MDKKSKRSATNLVISLTARVPFADNLKQTSSMRFSEAPLNEIYYFEYTLPSERYALVTQLSLKVNTAVCRGHIENDQLGYINSRLTCD